MIASIYQFQWLDAQMLLKPRRICPVITICLLCQQRIKKTQFLLKYTHLGKLSKTPQLNLLQSASISLATFFLSLACFLPSFLSCLSFSRSRQTTLSLTTQGGFHLHLLVFPFVYQFNSRIGVIVYSSFANDQFRRISTTFQHHFKICLLWFLHEKECNFYTNLFYCTEMR